MSDWKSDLGNFFENEKQKEKVESIRQHETASQVKIYLQQEVSPAMEELRSELEKHGREVSVHIGNDSASITVAFEGNEELRFEVKTNGDRVYPATRFREKTDGKQYISEGIFHGNSSKSNIHDVKKEDIIKSFLETYKDHVSK